MEQTSATMLEAITRDQLVQAHLRAGLLRHDLAQAAQKQSGTAGDSDIQHAA